MTPDIGVGESSGLALLPFHDPAGQTDFPHARAVGERGNIPLGDAQDTTTSTIGAARAESCRPLEGEPPTAREEAAMDIIAINGSPHRHGNTVTLINEILRGARENGRQGRITHLVDLDLDYCKWCGDCWGPTPGVCTIDDGFPAHLAELFAADVWIVATPSVNRSVTGYMKNWLDRLGASQLNYVVDEDNKVLEVAIADTLVVPQVGLTEGDTVGRKPDVMQKAYAIGRRL